MKYKRHKYTKSYIPEIKDAPPMDDIAKALNCTIDGIAVNKKRRCK